MKKILNNNIGKTITILISGIILGTLLLIGVFMLPTKRIENNVGRSVNLLVKEGQYHYVLEGNAGTMLDNYTDSLMLSHSIYNGKENLIDKSMHVYRYTTKDDSPLRSLNNHYTKEEKESTDSYGRYWHGYLVVLKPLLMILSYPDIRMLNGILEPLLVALVAVLMYKKEKKKYILPYIISILMVSPFTVALSLQFSSIFYISNISLLILLLLDNKLKTNKSYIFYFLIVGMITSYIDFLTYPLATLGMPLIMYFILKEEKDFIKNIKDLIINSIMWSIGYIGMWAGKIVIGSLLTGDNLFKSAFESFETRVSFEAQDIAITPLSVIKRNVDLILTKPHILLIMLVILYFIYKIIKNKTKITKNTFLKLIPYVLIFMYPFAWYIVASNHSFIHSFFTYRLLIVSVFALLSGVASILEIKKRK